MRKHTQHRQLLTVEPHGIPVNRNAQSICGFEFKMNVTTLITVDGFHACHNIAVLSCMTSTCVFLIVSNLARIAKPRGVPSAECQRIFPFTLATYPLKRLSGKKTSSFPLDSIAGLDGKTILCRNRHDE